MSHRTQSLPDSYPTATPRPLLHRTYSASDDNLRRRARGHLFAESPVTAPKVCLPPRESLYTPGARAHEAEEDQRQQESSSSSRFTILGPNPPQIMEVSSSEASNTTNDTRGSTTLNNMSLQRPASMSEIPHVFSTTSLTSSSPPRHIRLIRSHQDLSSYSTSEHSAFEKLDWVEYSAPLSDLAEYERLEGECTSSSDCSTSNQSVPVLLMNDEATVHKAIIDPVALMRTLEDCITLRPRLYTPAYGRTSRRPGLQTVPSETPPSSPTDHISAKLLNERKTSRIVKQLSTSPTPTILTETESESSVIGRRCIACGRKRSISRWIKMRPCDHTACSTCFSASLSAVSVSRLGSKCPGCMREICSFTQMDGSCAFPSPKELAASAAAHQKRKIRSTTDNTGRKVFPVLRIDNVAWDVTPQIVVDYLPDGVLPGEQAHPHPIHILLDRFDGRTKDYMYVEVASLDAARKVLKYRQNSFMPGGLITGGKKRPVTITLVTQTELLSELRPRSAQELHALLALCQAAVQSPPLCNPSLHHTTSYVVPSGLAHFVKSRHGPFYALMSIMTKMCGRLSPAYWDMFYVVSGAITALGNASSRWAYESQLTTQETALKDEDDFVLGKMWRMFLDAVRGKTQEVKEEKNLV